MKIKFIRGVEDVRIGGFAPVDYETPFVEVEYKGSIIFDLSFDGDSAGGDILVMFHDDIVAVVVTDRVLGDIINSAKKKLLNML